MNQLIVKQVAILSAILGGILGVLTVIPFISALSFPILMLGLAAIVIVYLKKNDLIGIIDVRDGAILGAIIGAVAFIAFSIVYIPLASLVGLIFKSYVSIRWVGMLFNITGFFVLVMLVIFVSLLCALFNSFTGLVTAYLYEILSGVKKEEAEKETIDFEIEE